MLIDMLTIISTTRIAARAFTIVYLLSTEYIQLNHGGIIGSEFQIQDFSYVQYLLDRKVLVLAIFEYRSSRFKWLFFEICITVDSFVTDIFLCAKLSINGNIPYLQSLLFLYLPSTSPF